MSERMIPLHIADQAVAAVEAELVKFQTAHAFVQAENVQLKGRVITIEAEVKCLEAVIRAHERIDCRAVTNLKKQLVEADAQIALLRKLGTEMGKHLPDTDAANRAYIDFEAGGQS
jgi:hypothetical protein